MILPFFLRVMFKSIIHDMIISGIKFLEQKGIYGTF